MSSDFGEGSHVSDALKVWPFGIMLTRVATTTIACPGCERRLTAAANAMRHHASDMTRALTQARSDLSEEQRKEWTAQLYASLIEAQAAWDAYREHLIEHGLLPSAS